MTLTRDIGEFEHDARQSAATPTSRQRHVTNVTFNVNIASSTLDTRIQMKTSRRHVRDVALARRLGFSNAMLQLPIAVRAAVLTSGFEILSRQ